MLFDVIFLHILSLKIEIHILISWFYYFFIETPQNVPVLSGRKAIVPLPRKTSGTIDVIGGTARDSRRPEGEPIQVAG